jgi:hypothetical protein
VSSKLNQDNGSGYFDYLRLQGSEQLRFRARTWDVSAEGKVSRYDYAKQRVSLTERSARERTELGFNLRGEKQLAKWVRLFAEYEYEKILSNQTLEEYSVNVVNGGLTWEF